MLLSGYWLAAGKAATLLDAIDTLQQSGDRWEERQLAQPRLEALAAVGDWKRLREFLPTARGLVDGDPLLGPMSDRAEARALAAEGRRDEAAAMLREAVDGFERFRFPFELARTQELLAEAVEPDEADGLRASALATFESLGAEPHATRVRAAIRGAARPDGALPAAPS
jgi:tetratricopeptide (TPR) repeat protein